MAIDIPPKISDNVAYGGGKWGKVANLPLIPPHEWGIIERLFYRGILPPLQKTMFLGEYSHNIDEKGRLTLPARWREQLGLRVVVTRGMEPCLFVFPAAKFETFLNEINTVGMTAADARGLSRFFSSKATDDELDKQGRISLPQNLREFAKLNGEVMVVGAFDHIELWSPSQYANADAELVNNVPDMSERVNQALQKMRA